MTARACASIAAMLDIADIVIGGIVPSVFGERYFDALAAELDQRSRLTHLADLRVRSVGVRRIGPLLTAAAIARAADAAREAQPAEPAPSPDAQ